MNPEAPTPAPTSRACDRCGAALPPDAPRGICPACLLQVGMESAPDVDDEATLTAGSTTAKIAAPPQLPDPDLLRPGQQFGNYRIGELLGKGGMGEVFEAEDIESGRRVALKVLRLKLDSLDARKRFLREGRMAAAINHPNSVYIYGTEEIEDQSVIAMELVERGTLKDKLHNQGEMPIGEAVDDILQIIAGLAAAHEKGVLHRDIKPSNCFVAADGSVKVGDFGLSVSSLAREDTQLTLTGTVMGTPAFASPEQLRGDELDVRSDIYSVGATLYFLLTGQAPLEAKNVVQMVATVLDKRPDSPRQVRQDIPEDLAEVILKCLAKQPDARYRDYASLQKALLPFSTRAVKPATLGLRTFAGAIDAFMLGLLVHVPLWMFGQSIDPMDYNSSLFGHAFAQMYLCGLLVRLLYFSMPESRWGVSLGKAICRIQVVNRDGSRIGVVRAFSRVLLLDLLTIGPTAVYMFVDPEGAMGVKPQPTALDLTVNYSFLLMLAIVFCRARLGNGYAGLHDLATGTRVIANHLWQERARVAAAREEWPELHDAPKLGPYHALASFADARVGDVIPAFDLMLRRQVWIRKAAEGSDMLPRAERRRSRAGRIRWINGSRRGGQAWDAYESLSGQPLATMLRKPQPWATVRYWLLDLTREFALASADDSLPEKIGIEHIWITGDGHAKLLDFAAPGVPAETIEALGINSGDGPEFEAGTFLRSLTDVSLKGGTPPPLHAGEIVQRFTTCKPAELIAGLTAATERIAVVSRMRRAGLVFFTLLPSILMIPAMLLGFHSFEKWERENPDIQPLKRSLDRLAWLRNSDTNRWRANQRAAMETYISGRYRTTVNDPKSWKNRYAHVLIRPERRSLAETLVKQPAPTAEELERSRRAIRKYLDQMQTKVEKQRIEMSSNIPGKILTSAIFVFTMTVVLPGLIAALAFRGGMLMHFLGLAFVNRYGQPAPRWRVFLRYLVTWCPVYSAAVYILSVHPGPLEFNRAVWICLGAYLFLTLTVFINPNRGLQDRLTGIWLVPR